MVKALLFDLDGVLVDAMDWHRRAFLEALDKEAFVHMTAEEHDALLAGRPTKEKLKILAQRGTIKSEWIDRIASAKQERTRDTVALHCKPDPKVIRLLDYFRTKYTYGVVTNCTRANAHQLLRYAGILPMMAVVISNEDVKEPKPSPEPYRLACTMLDVAFEEALAFEDHDIGMTSAFKAGVPVTQIKTPGELTIERVSEAIEQTERTIRARQEAPE